MFTAETWRVLVADAKADLAAMTMKQRMEMQRSSKMLYEGGKCPTVDLARVTAMCELLAETMEATEHGDARWTGRTQELVQVMLHKMDSISSQNVRSRAESQGPFYGNIPE